MNKDDKNRHFVLLIIDISKHGAKDLSDTGICTEVILIYKHGRPQWHRYNNLQTGIIVVVAADYKELLDIIEKNNFERNTRNDAYVSSIHSLVIVFVLKT